MHIPLLHLCRLWLISLLSTCAMAADPEPLRIIEKTASEWVKTRVETVRLETEWASDQILLKATISALKERAQIIEERKNELAAKTAEERADLGALEAKRKAAAEELDGVEERLKNLTAQLLELRPALPPRLSDALEMSFRSLAGTELSVGERMQLAMTVLNRCAQFNRSISHGAEVLTLESESGPKSLEVIYWGLSHGYALDAAPGKAWYGSPGADGWKWEPRPDAAAHIAKLIAIHTDKADPDFVKVPVHVKKTFTVSNP